MLALCGTCFLRNCWRMQMLGQQQQCHGRVEAVLSIMHPCFRCAQHAGWFVLQCSHKAQRCDFIQHLQQKTMRLSMRQSLLSTAAPTPHVTQLSTFATMLCALQKRTAPACLSHVLQQQTNRSLWMLRASMITSAACGIAKHTGQVSLEVVALALHCCDLSMLFAQVFLRCCLP